jgi:hypothetical protein
MYNFSITIDKTKVQSVNDSTSFIDVSGKIWTAAGNAKLSTGDYKFSPASGIFDGVTGTYISTPDHADFATGTGDYTIDFWFKTTSIGQRQILYQGNSAGDASSIAHFIAINWLPATGNDKLKWIPNYQNYPSHTVLSSTNNINDDAWHHAACVRYGDVFTLYLDGVYQSSVTLAGYNALDSTYPVFIGDMNPGTWTFPFTGNTDEFRFSKGIARWTTGFLPPTSKYSSDSYTKVLLHFGDDITNFPFLFNEGCSSIPAGFWSHVVDTVSGLDIRFFDTDGVTELKREIVLYSTGTSKVEAWVQILSLGTASNKIIYCQYGGPVRANDTTVWDDLSAKGVYHLSTLNDSSIQSTHLTNVGASSTTGKIENGYNFDGSHYVYRTDTDDKHDLTGFFTLSAWVNPTSLPGVVGTIISKRLNGSGTYNYIFDVTSTGNIVIYNNGLTPGSLTSTTTISTGIWSYATVVYNGSTIKIYINGIERGSQSVTGSPVADSGPFGIGADYPESWTDFLNGKVDEARVFSSVLSADWIKTEYNNQNDPATFSSCGTESSVIGEEIFTIWIPGIM